MRKITQQEAKDMYDSGIESLVKLARETYPDLFHEQKEWSDIGIIKGWYIDTVSSISYYNDDYSMGCEAARNVYPTKKEAEMALAMCQLLQWRDKANGEPLDDWCDWGDVRVKYSIFAVSDRIDFHYGSSLRHPLAFKTKKIRDQFLKDHKDLIKKAFGL